MGDKEFRDGFVVTHYQRRRSVVAKVTLRTVKTVNNLKHENGGRLVNWLKRQKIRIELDRWEAVPYTSIGFYIMRHPTMTWKPDFKAEVMRHVRMQDKESDGSNEVPEFVLYHDRKSFGAGASRVHATVMHV